MRIEFRYNYEDFAIDPIALNRIPKLLSRLSIAQNLVLLLFLASLLMIFASLIWLGLLGYWIAWVGLMVLALLLYAFGRALRRNEAGSRSAWSTHLFNDTWQLSLTDDGISMHSAQLSQLIRWEAVTLIMERLGSIRVGNKHATFHVPLRVFNGDSERVAFLNEIHHRAKKTVLSVNV